jgi:hypothetical protein
VVILSVAVVDAVEDDAEHDRATTGMWGTLVNVSLSDRQVIEGMLQLPATDRCTAQVPADVIRVLWPDVLGAPFNQDSPAVCLWHA